MPSMTVGAEHLSRRREVPQPPARHLHRRPAVPAVAELPRRSDRDRLDASAPPSGRWSRSPAPCITRPQVIIFDEPTATLTPEEKRHFFALMQRLKAARRVDHLHQPRAGRGARACRPHHRPARRRAGRHRRTAGEFDRDKVVRAMVGPHAVRRNLRVSADSGANPQAPARRCCPSRTSRMGNVGAQQLLLDLRAARSPACSG